MNDGLLLMELCCRLPYGVVCRWEADGCVGGGKLIDVCKNKTQYNEYWDCYFEGEGEAIQLEHVKPYLRRMSSMSVDEKNEYDQLMASVKERFLELTMWLYSHHLDPNGMIDNGLAIEVTKENNPYMIPPKKKVDAINIF